MIANDNLKIVYYFYQRFFKALPQFYQLDKDSFILNRKMTLRQS